MEVMVFNEVRASDLIKKVQDYVDARTTANIDPSRIEIQFSTSSCELQSTVRVNYSAMVIVR